MRPLHNSTSSELLSDLDTAVRSDGDPLDAIAPQYRSPGLDTLLTLGPASAIWYALSDSPGSHEFRTTMPITTLGITALAFVGHTLYQRRAQARYSHSQHLQDSLRESISEPVDLLRSSSTDRDYQTILRWYGADGTTAAPVNESKEESDNNRLRNCARLRNLLDITDLTDVDKIAFGTDWLAGTEDHLVIGDFGTVVDGSEFIQQLGKNEHIRIRDTTIDEPVLISTPDQCRQLLKEACRSMVSDIRPFLATTIEEYDPTSRVPELFGAWMEAGGNPEAQGMLKRRLQTEIERTLTLMLDSERLTVRGERNETYRLRTTQNLSVRNNVITVQYSYHDLNGLPQTAMAGGQQSLLKHLGFGSIEQLMEQLTDGSNPAAAGLYAKSGLLLLLKEANRGEDRWLPTTASSETGATDTKTTLTRLQSEKPWRESRKSRTAKLEAGTSEISFDRPMSRKRAVRQIIRIAGGLSLAMYGSLAALAYNAHATDLATDQSATFLETYGFDAAVNPDLYQHYLEDQSWYDGLMKTIVVSAQTAEVAVETKLVNAAESIGLIGLLSNGDNQKESGTVPSNSGNSTHPMEAGIGDAPKPLYSTPGDVHAMYTVAAQGNNSAEGYWATEVDDKLTLTQTPSYPFSDASIGFVESSFTPERHILPMSPPENSSVMFEVSAQYAPGQVQILMPVKNNTTPLAAQITYNNQNGQKVTEVPVILHEESSGMYIAERVSSVSDSDQTSPKLTYWLTASDNIIKTRGPLRTPPDVDMRVVQQATKDALGLSFFSSDIDVFEAIKLGKVYRYNPFADADTKAIQSNYGYGPAMDNTPTLVAIGESMARLRAANCNIAIAQDMLSTSGSYDGKNTNVVVGFNNTNGDGYLDPGESHAWATDTDGKIIDATPAAEHISPTNSADTAVLQFDNPAIGAFALLALTGAGSLAYGRKRRFRERADSKGINNVLNGRHTGRAITALQHAEYALNTPMTFRTDSAPSWIASLESRPIKDRMTALPELDYKQAKQLLRQQQVRVPFRVRQAMRYMLQYQQAILHRKM